MSVLSRFVPFASQHFPRLSSRVLASSGYTLDVAAFGPDAFSVWDDSTAERQNRAWQPIVEAAKAGRFRDDVASFLAALGEPSPGSQSVLESGCGGGYNSELISLWNPSIEYLGIDLSPSMVAVAARHYPQRAFVCGSAYSLPTADASRDIVIDGVALLHMPEWKVALAEYARVSRRVVILHGLTLTDTEPTTPFAKYAYGQPSLEFVFNREEMLEAVDDVGLVVEGVYPGLDYDLEPYLNIPSVSEAWRLVKRG